MSSVKVVHYLLVNDSGLTAVVAAPNIMASVVPVNTALPAVGITEISAVERIPLATNPAQALVTSRVQVTAMTKTYADQKTILGLIRSAVPNTSGAVNGVTVDSILPDTVGPDMKDEDAGTFYQSRDFIVKYIQ